MGGVAQFFLGQPKLFAWAHVSGKYKRTISATNPNPDGKAVMVSWEHANAPPAEVNFLNHWLELNNRAFG